MLGARKEIAWDIEVSGECARDAIEVSGYQGSLDWKAESASKEKAAEKKSISEPALRPPKYKAHLKKDEAVAQGEDSEDEFDAMLNDQLGIDADKVPIRDDDETVTYILVKMTVIEGLHPLEHFIKGFTDLVHYVTIADESAEFQGLYSKQEVDQIKLESQVPTNGV